MSFPWQSISKWWFMTSDGCTKPPRWLCNGSWCAIGLLISVIAIDGSLQNSIFWQKFSKILQFHPKLLFTPFFFVVINTAEDEIDGFFYSSDFFYSCDFFPLLWKFFSECSKIFEFYVVLLLLFYNTLVRLFVL